VSRIKKQSAKSLPVAILVLAALFVVQVPSNRNFFSQTRSTSSQLVSIDPMPLVDGNMCQWLPASSSAIQKSTANAGEADSRQSAKRIPLRVIHDPSAGFSSVAVDPLRNEIVMTDENLFQIVVYDRLTNTPPSADMSEPKRAISGLNTKIEFQCGVYIDPATGDIYAVNNDTVDALVIFSRNAKGNVPPDREIQTPHGTFGVAVNELAQELFLTVQHDSAVVVYRKSASGEEHPIRLLQGDRTGLADPHGIAIDPENKLM
jgi:hypothetical protein